MPATGVGALAAGQIQGVFDRVSPRWLRCEPSSCSESPSGEEIAIGGHMGETNSLAFGGKFDRVIADDISSANGVDVFGPEIDLGPLPERLGNSQGGSGGSIAFVNVVRLEQIHGAICCEQASGLNRKMRQHGDPHRGIRGDHDRDDLCRNICCLNGLS